MGLKAKKPEKSKRGPGKLDRIAGPLVDRLKKSPRFYSIPKTASGDDFFIFRRAGDTLYGCLYGKHSQVGVARSCSYRMLAYQAIQDGKKLPVDPEGQIVEFPGCALLQRIIDNPKNDLRGSLVKIVYVGRLKKSRGIGRSMKIFEVYKDKGTITPNLQRQQPKRKRG